MPGIVTSKTRGLYERPPEGEFVFNTDCDSAVGLVAFWPLTGSWKGRELDQSRRGKFPLTVTGTPSRGPVRDGGQGYVNNGTSTIYLNTVATPPVTAFPFTWNAWFLPRTSTEYGAESGLIHSGNSAGSNYAVLVFDGANGEGAGAHKVVMDTSGGGQNIQGSTGSLAAAGTVGMATAVYSTTTSHTVYLNAAGTLSTATVTAPSGWDRYTVGAYRDGGGTFNPANLLLWWATVHNVAKSAAQVARMYDGRYRYELAYVLGRTTYGFAPPTAIAFDAASNSGYQAASSSYSWSHTCTGSNRFLAVDVALLSAGSTVTSITYNGVALSAISGAAISTVTSFGRIECWGLANPASGSNSIAVTLSGSIISAGTAVSYTGVHQTVPTEAGNAAQATNVPVTDATVTVTPVADKTWLHAAIATNDTTVTGGQTERNNVSGAGGTGGDEDTGPISPAAATAMTYPAVSAFMTWAIAGYAIRPVGAASGTTYTVSITDTLGGSDSMLRVANGLRAFTQNLGVSDSMLRVANALRAYTQNLGAQDAYSRVADAKRALTDALGAADAYARTANGLRALSDSLGLSDTFARVANALRSISQNLGVSDSMARQATANRVITETAGFQDAFARLAAANRSYSDTVGTQDTFARVANALRRLTDTLGLSDSAALQLVGAGVLTIAVADFLGLSDSAQRRADANRAYADALGLADAVLRVAQANRSFSQNLGLSDSFARQATAARQVADNLGTSDAFQRVANAGRALTDTAGTADTMARVADALRRLTDTLGLHDAQTLQLVAAGTLLIAVADALGLSDSVQRRADANRLLTEAVGLTDLAALLAFAAAVADLDGVGWYASDDGLIRTRVGLARLYPGEVRGTFLDFSATAEIRAGDTIASASVVAPAGVVASPAVVTGDRVTYTLSQGTPGGEYFVGVAATTPAGAVIVRSAPVAVPGDGPITYPPQQSVFVSPAAALGWYASDTGLVPGRAAWRGGRAGERRKFFVDFGGMAELRAGDTLQTAQWGFYPAGPSANLAVGISGTVATGVLSGFTAGVGYLVACKVTTAGGSTLVRYGGYVADLGPVSFAFPGPGSAAVPPVALGWYASDDGLVAAHAAPHRKAPAGRRRVFLDFGAVAEVLAGDTIASARVGFYPAGPALDDVTVAGARVSATMIGGTAGVEYLVGVEATFASGGVVFRAGRVIVEAVT